ncbi:MAG TPA: hypothetical protein VHG89_11340 [Verrucomicrobiae bacterium]|nr:hypothetical protein [Verrucomicrobiae bacterium]
MKSILLIFSASLCLALFTGCQTEEEQVQHTQDRQQEKLMKQMQKQQDAAKKLSDPSSQ